MNVVLLDRGKMYLVDSSVVAVDTVTVHSCDMRVLLIDECTIHPRLVSTAIRMISQIAL